LLKDFDFFDDLSAQSFKQKYVAHLSAHYDEENSRARIMDFVNLLTVGFGLNEKIRDQFFKVACSAWMGQSDPTLKKIVFFLHRNLKNISDFVDIVKGIFFLEWAHENKSLQAYNFPFSQNPNEPRFYFLLNNDGKQHFLLADNTPWKIIESLFSALNRFEEALRADGNIDLLETLSDVAVGSKIGLLKKERGELLNRILDSCRKPTLSTALKMQFADQNPVLKTCKAVLNEANSINDPATLKVIHKKCVRFQIECALEKEHRVESKFRNLLAVLLNIFNTTNKSNALFIISEINKLLANDEIVKLCKKKRTYKNLFCIL